MSYSRTRLLVRLLPVLLAVAAAALWIGDVQPTYLARNLVPLAALLGLAALTLHRGAGRWTGNGLRMPLGTLGFAIPALGLSLYLYYAYAVDLNGMFTDAPYPERVFRYLPAYTLVAGSIGFAIGWIAGRNL